MGGAMIARGCVDCDELSAVRLRKCISCGDGKVRCIPCRTMHLRRNHAVASPPCPHCGGQLVVEEPATRSVDPEYEPLFGEDGGVGVAKTHAFNLAIWTCAACRCLYHMEIEMKPFIHCGLERSPERGHCLECNDETVILPCAFCDIADELRCLACNARHNEGLHATRVFG